MKETKAIVQRWMDPVSVALNLWASQYQHYRSGGAGMVGWGDVFQGVPVDEDWAAIPDPADYRMEGDGQPPKATKVCERSDDDYDATKGKAMEAPSWDWTTFSACEVVEWAISQYTGDRDALKRLLLAVHPDAGRFAPSDYPKDPFEFHARKSLDDGASGKDVTGFARIQRSTYSAFRRLVWMAVGEQTRQDALGKEIARQKYLEARRHLNKLDAQELTERKIS